MRKVVGCKGPVTRRSFLEVGSLGICGLGLSHLLRLKAQARQPDASPVETSVILVWLPGGPPHMETFDMKPDAPVEYRGEFRPIRTVVPGMEVCEHLPRFAKIADKYSIIRSIAHEFADHGGGHKRFLTGRDPREPTGFVNDYPMVGSIVAKMREGRSCQKGVPDYVNFCDHGRQHIDVFSFGSAYLGPETHPFTVPGDPSRPEFQVHNLCLHPDLAGRLEDRRLLLAGFDRLAKEIDGSGVMDALDEFNRRAIELLTSPRVRQAFDLSQESPAIREKYGRHAWGQRALLARRLIEAGSSFVTVVMENPLPSGGLPKYAVYNWDSHAVNCHIFDDFRLRAPYFDQAVTALIEDVYLRGLDHHVMIIVTGEFGRTPRINPAVGTQTGVMQPGRDHWPQAMSVVVAGGRMRTGQVVGATNARGEYPKERPLTPNDLWATMFRHLGIDIHHTFPDHAGRPMPILPYGQVISELL
ncbi:MAG: hypothetical protein KatS3mg110_3183 [Pirellulaceae bacterium]|nr:MAG: hypothetical protein KatS3mg110_3183 [Pirellulaceae bacterium]